jgi:invasion protein IalB
MLRRAFFTLLSLAVLAGAGRAQSPNQWVRYCGKEDKEGPNVCITKYVHSETFSRMPIFSVALRDTRLDSKETRHFTVSVPLGVLLPPGIGVTFAPGDRWEQVAKTGNLEEGDKVRVWSFETKYTHCNVLGCVAEVEATQEILAGLQTSGTSIHTAMCWVVSPKWKLRRRSWLACRPAAASSSMRPTHGDIRSTSRFLSRVSPRH